MNPYEPRSLVITSMDELDYLLETAWNRGNYQYLHHIVSILEYYGIPSVFDTLYNIALYLLAMSSHPLTNHKM